MDAITMFKEAAKQLQKEQVYLMLDATRKANDEDRELQSYITDFETVRMDLSQELESEERDEALVADLNLQINELYNKIMSNQSMMEYNEAKQDITQTINYINAIITAAVDGEDPMLVEEPVSSCGSGGCASCSGCS